MIRAEVFLGYFEGLLGDNKGTVILACTIKLVDLHDEAKPFTVFALRKHG